MEEKLKKENKINAVNLLVCLSLSETITFYILQFLKFVIKIIENKIAKKSIILDIIRIDGNYSIYSNNNSLSLPDNSIIGIDTILDLPNVTGNRKSLSDLDNFSNGNG